MSKRPAAEFDFKPFGAAIKAARMARKESRKEAAEALNISPRYLANIENVGQKPSLPVFIDLVMRYNISVDQFILPDVTMEKSERTSSLILSKNKFCQDAVIIRCSTKMTQGNERRRSQTNNEKGNPQAMPVSPQAVKTAARRCRAGRWFSACWEVSQALRMCLAAQLRDLFQIADGSS